MQSVMDAVKLIAAADGLLIAAGAGLGVDSSLPDFRGPEGFWGVYPGLNQQGMRFSDVARQEAFRSKPELAWGFYGHRLALYRRTKPHAGFTMLLDMAARLRRGAFVFTSNVDGHFQKAEFAPRSRHPLRCPAENHQPSDGSISYS